MSTHCPRCARKFPEELISQMCVNGDYVTTCPLCVLQIMREVHGDDTLKFEAPVASRKYAAAVALYGEACR